MGERQNKWSFSFLYPGPETYHRTGKLYQGLVNYTTGLGKLSGIYSILADPV